MSFHTYILYSKALAQYYIGHTGNLQDRLNRHTNSGSKSTKKANDWALAFSKQFDTKSEAAQYEYFIKSKKSRKYVEWLIQSLVN